MIAPAGWRSMRPDNLCKAPWGCSYSRHPCRCSQEGCSGCKETRHVETLLSAAERRSGRQIHLHLLGVRRAVNDRTSQAAASNRKGSAKEFFFVIIPLPSIDLPFNDLPLNDACARNSQGSMPPQPVIPLKSYPARNPEVSGVVVLVWTDGAEA